VCWLTSWGKNTKGLIWVDSDRWDFGRGVKVTEDEQYTKKVEIGWVVVLARLLMFYTNLRNASLSSVARLFPKVKKTASGKHIETHGGVLKS